MSRLDPPRPPVTQRLVLIVTAMAAMGVVLLAIQHTSTKRAATAARVPEAIDVEAGDPIASEAMVFRTRPGMLAVEPDSRRRPDAHPGEPAGKEHLLVGGQHRVAGVKQLQEFPHQRAMGGDGFIHEV